MTEGSTHLDAVTSDIHPLSPDPNAALAEPDVRAIVKLLGKAITSRRDPAGVRELLMEGLCELTKADAWAWSLACAAQPGEQPVYLGMAHGGFDEERYGRLVLAAGHPDMAWISAKLLGEMREHGSHVTRLRMQIVDEESFAASGVNASLCDADIGPFIFSLRPIDERAVSTLCIYRRRCDPPFTRRESRIVHIVLSELPWLHEQGWPEDRGNSVPRLAPRLRLVLNLLLDGRSLKDMAVTLSLSQNTIAGYKKLIYSHFGVNSHAALMRRFRSGDGGDF